MMNNGQQQYSQGQLDAMARDRGFPDYPTWVAWERHRQAGMQQPGGASHPQQNNWLQNLLQQIPGHPAQLFDYIGRRFRQATGQEEE